MTEVHAPKTRYFALSRTALVNIFVPRRWHTYTSSPSIRKANNSAAWFESSRTV